MDYSQYRINADLAYAGPGRTEQDELARQLLDLLDTEASLNRYLASAGHKLDLDSAADHDFQRDAEQLRASLHAQLAGGEFVDSLATRVEAMQRRLKARSRYAARVRRYDLVCKFLKWAFGMPYPKDVPKNLTALPPEAVLVVGIVLSALVLALWLGMGA